MRKLLSLAGRNGAHVVLAGVLLGLAAPAVADAARPLLAAAIFAFTFGAALKVQPDALRNEAAHLPRTTLILVVATFGVPLLIGGLLLLLRPDPSLAQGIMFWAIVPTSPATVAFAAILGLPTSLALIITLVATAAAPAYLTLLAMAQDGLQLAADPLALCLKLLALTGSAFLAAALTRRFASATLARNPDVLTGIAVLALCLAGLGSMTGMQAAAMAEPERLAAITALAYGVTILVQAFGTALFWRCGREVALTAGLACSARTLTLAWVMFAAEMTPLANAFLGGAMVAKYTLPLLTRTAIARLGRPPA
jgi:BASS family bile acid:Na+ symporter